MKLFRDKSVYIFYLFISKSTFSRERFPSMIVGFFEVLTINGVCIVVSHLLPAYNLAILHPNLYPKALYIRGKNTFAVGGFIGMSKFRQHIHYRW